MKKKCKVVALTTEATKEWALAMRAAKHPKEDRWLVRNNEQSLTWGWYTHHLYLISDDEIKVGDWYYFHSPEVNDAYVRAGFNNSIHQCTDVGLGHVASNSKMLNPKMYCRKIIATTDPTLNLPLIPEEFVKSYCENPVDEVFANVFPKLDNNFNPTEEYRVEISSVETSWNKDQIEFWLMQDVADYFNLSVLDPNEIIEALLPTLDDLGQRFKEFQEDMKADMYKRDFEDREWH